MNTILKQLLLCLLLCSSLVLFSQNEDDVFENLEKAKDLKSILDYDEALKYCETALSIAIQIDNTEYEAKAYREIGTILMSDKKLLRSRNNLNKAAKIQKENNFQEELAKTRNAQGLLNTELGNYLEALSYFDKALKIYQSLSLFSSRTKVLKNKGTLYLSKNDFNKANKTFDLAYKQAKKFAQTKEQADILLHKSEALNNLTRYNEAIKSCKKAIEIGSANKYQWIITNGYKTLSNIYENDGNPSKAIELLKTHNKLLDSVYSINEKRLSAESIAKLDFEKQDRLIEQKEEIIQQKEDQIKSSKNLTFLGISFLILFFSFIIVLFNNNQKRKKANLLLQNTNSQLVHAKNEAEKATKAKANFLSTITHELRTPLYTVTGLTDLLLDEDPKDSQKGYLKSLRFSGDYLLNFINDILDVNKIEAKKIELEKIPFNLKKLAREVLYTQNKAAKDNNTQLHLNYEESLPKYLLGDSLRLSQVLINLTSNAIKFTKNGNVNLNIKKIDRFENTIELLFEIKDNGIGISFDKQDEIFESFSQGSIEINRKYGGTGLGLTIVKNLLEIMNSKIQLKSKPKAGTTFYFEIGFEIAKKESIKSIKEKDSYPEDLLEVLRNKKVLLVDDVKINQLITQKTLTKKDIICVTADNGENAVLKAQEQEFDLILMDIHMPGIGGVEATKQIRAFNSITPIIALTAITIEKEDLIRFNKAGFNDILSKPFKADNFFNKIYLQLIKKH
ncbi:ATP-binding protein [Flavobacteriaceae bacterium]|jgi:signal transduction histidine kinase/ActR/RegA family two-component response regulator|nr:ATP-binding protein [Flavobacteriaceae bacterium]